MQQIVLKLLQYKTFTGVYLTLILNLTTAKSEKSAHPVYNHFIGI